MTELLLKDHVDRAGDPVLAFGGDPIKNLLSKIEAAMRQGRFSQRPIGPLGSLLSLADDKWAVAVEFAIGRCFNDFLVSSTRDHDVLKVTFTEQHAKMLRLAVLFHLHITWRTARPHQPAHHW